VPQSDRASHLAFAVASYGRGQLRFLAPHMHSVALSHPDATELILWRDMPTREVAYLERAYPNAAFTPLDVAVEGRTDQRISRKMLAWEIACQRLADQPICFIDTDTLVLRPLTPFLDEPFDFAFTWKDHVYPLNTGVVLVGSGRKALPLLREWAARTARIVADRDLLARALKDSGGGDQQALRELIGFANYDRTYTQTIAGQTYVLRGLPCHQLNEVRSVPITDDTYIIHYKGGWHPILLHGAPYSRHRPEETSAQMHRLWLDTKADSDRHVARGVVGHAWRTHGQAAGNAAPDPLAVAAAVCADLGVEAVLTVGSRAQDVAAAMTTRLDSAEVVPRQTASAVAKDVRRLAPRRVAVVADAGVGPDALASLARTLAVAEHVGALFVTVENAAEAALAADVADLDRTLWLPRGQGPDPDGPTVPDADASSAAGDRPDGPGLLVALGAPPLTPPASNRFAPLKRMLLPLARRLGLR